MSEINALGCVSLAVGYDAAIEARHVGKVDNYQLSSFQLIIILRNI